MKTTKVLFVKIVLCVLLSVALLVLFSHISEYMYSQHFLEQYVPSEENLFARNFLELLRQNNYDLAEREVALQYRTPETRANMQKIGEILRRRVPISGVELIGYTFHVEGLANSKLAEISYLSRHDDLWQTTTIAINNINNDQGKFEIVGFSSQDIPKSFIDRNKFNLTNKSPIHYFMLFLTVIMPAFVLFTAGLCIRLEKGALKAKWLWFLFILLGFGKLTFDWTTTDFIWKPNTVSFMSASVYKIGPYGAWLFSISLPIGAIAFIEKLRRLKGKVAN